ncbi:HIT family protein, partial [Pseudomonas sp. BIS1]|uniref:HIT family protein n=1 Tax=Pseudomonas sp. BIS1 TaxID=2807722 RepID=UPI001EEE7F60
MSGFPMDCVFCAIAGGREPAHRLFEDEHFIVLLDIFPLRPAHVLIVAREHAPHLSDLSAAARDALLALAERIGRALRRAGFGVEGINLLLNDGVAADQHVAHLHLHLIPRRGPAPPRRGVRRPGPVEAGRGARPEGGGPGAPRLSARGPGCGAG